MTRVSPLDAVHRGLGARMVPFGGWEMPLEYTGTIQEHMACRNSAAIFDVSHLGTVRLEGDDAFQRLQRTFTNDLAKIGPGRAQYTHLLDDTDGSVADDIIVWWHPEPAGRPPVFDVMPNASNTDRVLEAVGGRDITDQRAVLAVQGPDARTLAEAVWPEVAGVGRFKVARCAWRDTECVVAGTGYTGEPGIEVAIDAARAPELWDALVDAGVTPAGLGARDTLRLEAGLPLHGHELGPGITPLQAGLAWVVAFGKPAFRGRQALLDEQERGVARHIVGIATDGRRPPRSECTVLSGDRQVGVVTSGNFSPVLGHGIALALVEPAIGVGDAVVVDVRGSQLAGVVVETPFVRR